MPVDDITLRFSPAGLTLLNVILGLVIFGIALDLRPSDFRQVLANRRPAVIGLLAQFLLLPALTAALVAWTAPHPSMALGMLLVASCPGGNISNFLTHLAKGNTALSVGLTGLSTAAATILTPLNFTTWASLLPSTAGLLRDVSLDPLDMLFTVAALLGIPITVGMTLAHRRPDIAQKLRRPMKTLSLIFFTLFVVIALAVNFDHFIRHIGLVAGLVLLHNTSALALGYFAARGTGLPEVDRRAVTLEVGLQNSGLALILIFNFFDGLGGMALVAAWWGVWHLISGLTLATFWSHRRLPSQEIAHD